MKKKEVTAPLRIAAALAPCWQVRLSTVALVIRAAWGKEGIAPQEGEARGGGGQSWLYERKRGRGLRATTTSYQEMMDALRDAEIPPLPW